MQVLPVTMRPLLVLCSTVVLCWSLSNTAIAGQEKSGGWRLADASSPYLQLHADNPVEWYPWGEAAFARARRRASTIPLIDSAG